MRLRVGDRGRADPRPKVGAAPVLQAVRVVASSSHDLEKSLSAYSSSWTRTPDPARKRFEREVRPQDCTATANGGRSSSAGTPLTLCYGVDRHSQRYAEALLQLSFPSTEAVRTGTTLFSSTVRTEPPSASPTAPRLSSVQHESERLSGSFEQGSRLEQPRCLLRGVVADIGTFF